MSNATRIRRAFRDGAKAIIRIQLSIFSTCAIDRTLLGEVLSDFDQVYALLSAIDLFNKRLQVAGAEHSDDTRWMTTWKCIALDVVRCLAGSFFVLRNKR